MPTPTPSPLLQKQSLALSHDAEQQQSPLADLASQLGEQTIRVEPTYLYDYSYGLPSPISSNGAEGSTFGRNCDDEFPGPDDFPTVDTDADNDADSMSMLIPSVGLKYRSTRVYNSAAGTIGREFRVRRWKRQVASRILCERGLEKIVQSLEDNSQTQLTTTSISTGTSTSTSTCTTSLSEPIPNLIPQEEPQQQQHQQHQHIEPQPLYQPPLLPAPLDEGFFDGEEETADAEALRLFQLERPAGIRKWREVGAGVRNGVMYRPSYYRAGGNGEREGMPNMVPSVPRMRRKIARRKRSREGVRDGGVAEA